MERISIPFNSLCHSNVRMADSMLQNAFYIIEYIVNIECILY